MSRYIVSIIVLVCTFVVLNVNSSVSESHNTHKYLVIGSEGPGFSSPEETVSILENLVIPSFNKLISLEKEGIITGGLPVGDRAFVFVIEASSNEEVDQILRSLPLWGVLKWKVKPLQSFKGRSDIENKYLEEIKKSN
jgi:hypothetical protein